MRDELDQDYDPQDQHEAGDQDDEEEEEDLVLARGTEAEEEDVGTPPPVLNPVPTRGLETAPQPEEPSDDCMPVDADGYTLISRFAYDPEEAVVRADITQVMENAGLATEEQIQSQLKWTIAFKKHCGNWNCDRIVQEILKNADDIDADYNTIEQMQDSWATALTDDDREDVSSQLLPLWSTGYFLSENFRYESERDYMEERKVRYDPTEPEVLGCCREASRAKGDVIRRINSKGKKIHGCIITEKAAPNGIAVKQTTRFTVRESVSLPKGSLGDNMKEGEKMKRTKAGLIAMRRGSKKTVTRGKYKKSLLQAAYDKERENNMKLLRLQRDTRKRKDAPI